jgi:hypothetical protein
MKPDQKNDDNTSISSADISKRIYCIREKHREVTGSRLIN